MKLKLHKLMCVSLACLHMQLSAQEANQAEISIASLPVFDCIIKPGKVVDVGTAVPGVIDEVFVDIGDFVHKGMPLAKLDLSVEQASLELARAKAQSSVNIELRKEQANFTIRSKERSDQLYAKSLISSQNIDQAQTEQRVALLQLQEAKDQSVISQLDFLRISELLEQGTIRSPIEGLVMDRFKSAGEYVKDTPLMRVAQLHPLHVEVIVPVEYMGMINSGIQADVTPSVLGYKSKRATVERIDRVADTASGTFGVRLNLPNEDQKIPGGLRCKMAFVADSVQSEELAQQTEVITDEESANSLDTTLNTTIVAKQVVDAQNIEPVLETELEESLEEENFEKVVLAKQTNNSPVSLISTQEPPNLQCFAIGPIDTKDSAIAISNKLNDSAQSLFIREIGSLEIKDYLVLSKQLQNKAAVQDLKAKYLQAGIKNMYALGENDSVFSLRLSLGAFSVRANADAHQARLVKLGFEPQIVPRERERSKYWLDISFIESMENTNKIKKIVQQLDVSSAPAPEACSSKIEEQLAQNM